MIDGEVCNYRLVLLVRLSLGGLNAESFPKGLGGRRFAGFLSLFNLASIEHEFKFYLNDELWWNLHHFVKPPGIIFSLGEYLSH